jgi:hypothetical protein
VTLDFLSPSLCGPGTLASPLARALGAVSDTGPAGDGRLHPIGVRHRLQDLSLQGKVEVRGDVDDVRPFPGEELIRFSPRRALLLVDGDAIPVIERLREEGRYAYDATGALAGLAFEGEQVARRLTDLDLDRLPAAGSFAKIGAVLVRDEGERFRVYFPQELGHYVAEVVLDAIEGLRTAGVWLKPDPEGLA